MSTRPRRTTRPPARLTEPADIAPAPATAKKPRADPQARLVHLLTNPKSPLTRIDISDILNAAVWHALPPAAQARLAALLPQTASRAFAAAIEPHHPSQRTPASLSDVQPNAPVNMQVDAPADIDSALFTDAHFLAAAHTFQDHIFSGWASPTHAARVARVQKGLWAGTLAAPWKDDAWAAAHPPAPPIAEFSSESSARAGAATSVKLVDLARNGILRVGDVIVYRRHFAVLDLVVEKDAIIDAIHPRTHVLTVLSQSGPTPHLPRALLLPQGTAPLPDAPTAAPPPQAMDITSPSMLETGVLDLDARIDRARRPNGNAWKCFSVWRWRDGGAVVSNDVRAGRENHGTLFYLRGSFYHDHDQ